MSKNGKFIGRRYFPEPDLSSFKWAAKKNSEEYHCDLAPTGKAMCYSCHEKVPYRTPRVWYKDEITKNIKMKNKNPHIKETHIDVKKQLDIKRIICYKCAPKELQVEHYRLYMKIKKLSKTIKKFKRALKGKKADIRIKSLEIVEVLKEETEETEGLPHIILRPQGSNTFKLKRK